MEKTAKGHFGGGDTAWEEEKGILYKDSDLRLAEIHERLCNEITIGKDQVAVRRLYIFLFRDITLQVFFTYSLIVS